MGRVNLVKMLAKERFCALTLVKLVEFLTKQQKRECDEAFQASENGIWRARAEVPIVRASDIFMADGRVMAVRRSTKLEVAWSRTSRPQVQSASISHIIWNKFFEQRCGESTPTENHK